MKKTIAATTLVLGLVFVGAPPASADGHDDTEPPTECLPYLEGAKVAFQLYDRQIAALEQAVYYRDDLVSGLRDANRIKRAKIRKQAREIRRLRAQLATVND